MNLKEILSDVMERRPRRYVDDLEEWRTTDGRRGRYAIGTGRFTDLTHGTKKSVVITTRDPYPFREEEFAQPWLRSCWERGSFRRGMASKRVPWTRPALRHLDQLPPAFFAGKVTGEWAYVDVVQAYPSIYSRLALDMKWVPNPDRPMLGMGAMLLEADDEILSVKPMHRAVGGIIRSTEMREMVDGRPRTVSTLAWARFLAPDLWGVIQWTLHCIARMAIDEFGAVLWDTDGGVVRLERAVHLIAAIEERWGLEARVEHRGRGTILGLKRWRIGDDKTAGPANPLRPTSNVLEPSPAVVAKLQTLTPGRQR